ncbi:unnamed protein product, partial [Nesidiocoris tenuis]
TAFFRRGRRARRPRPPPPRRGGGIDNSGGGRGMRPVPPPVALRRYPSRLRQSVRVALPLSRSREAARQFWQAARRVALSSFAAPSAELLYRCGAKCEVSRF